MPTYTFEDTKTGEVFEIHMMMSEHDEFKKENPHLKQLILGAPSIVNGHGDRVKPDESLKEVFAKAAEAHPNSPLADRYGKKSIKQIKTREALKKHGVISKDG